MNDISIASLFNNYFEVIPANTDKLIEKVYHIRHQVYCEELGFEDKKANHLEFDEYDLRSSHCLLFHKASQSYAGCARLILADGHDPEAKFPFEVTTGDLLNWDFNNPDHLRRKYGECSRVAITSQFRRRRGETNTPDGGSEAIENSQMDARRRFPSVALGLYLASTAIAIEKELEGVFVIMELRLARQLRRLGFMFEQVGDAVKHRGERAPFIINISEIPNTLKPDYLQLLNHIQDQVHSNTHVISAHNEQL
jgi:N-acyl amino acid synthase of PEP-CTERM/exosortase system